MKHLYRIGLEAALPIAICFLLASPKANAQISIYGTSSISYDQFSGTVQSISETQVSDAFYTPGVDAVLSGPVGYTTGSDRYTGSLSLSLDVQDSYGTYNVDSSHYVVIGEYDIYDVFDQASWSPTGGFFGNEYANGYDGYTEQCYDCGGGETLQVGSTYANMGVDAPCPTSITLQSLQQIPITTDPSLRTGYGAMAAMLTNPTSTDWSKAVIKETVTPGANNCPSTLNPAFSTITVANSSTFNVGFGAQDTRLSGFYSKLYSHERCVL